MADSDRVDAERWRALTSSERILFLGYGQGETHFAMEFWGRRVSTRREDTQTAEAKRILTKYADDRRRELSR